MEAVETCLSALNFLKAPKGIPLDVPGPRRTYKRTLNGLKVLSPAIHTGNWSLWVRVRSIVYMRSLHGLLGRKKVSDCPAK